MTPPLGFRPTDGLPSKGSSNVLNGNEASAIEVMAMRTAWCDLAIRWELTWQERRMLLPTGGEDLEQPPANTERRMRLLIEIGHRLRFEDDATLCEWLRMPSELWYWYSPLEVMGGSLPDLRRLRQFVELGLGS